VSDLWRFLRACAGGLLAASVLFPGMAGVSAVTMDLADWPHGWSGAARFFFATGLAAAALVPLAVPFRRFATADRSNPAAYGMLLEIYSDLAQRVEVAPPAAKAALVAHANFVGSELGAAPNTKPSVGLRWLLASGYIALWARLHRIEEGLIGFEGPEVVLAGAINDELRIEGSPIAHESDLLAKLRRAVAALRPWAVGYLNSPPAAVPAPAPGAPAPPTPTPDQLEADARAVLRTVRKTINDFRDSRRAGIVRARSALFVTVISAGVVAYVLLGVAIVEEVGTTQVVALSVFYLVGSLIGLFKQLRAASAADIVIEEDYGLSTARLVHTPLFSGLAAVGGVVVTALLNPLIPSPTQNSTTTTSTTAKTHAASPGATTGGAPVKTSPAAAKQVNTVTENVASLDRIFNLKRNTYGLIFAAIFGLTPNLLIIRLQRQAEQYKADLKSSEAGEQATPAAPA